MGMNNKWHKFDPDKGLPRETVILAFCKDGKTYAGVRTCTNVNKWNVFGGSHVENDHNVSEILYWTDDLGTPTNVKKVFISQPMNGRTAKEIKDERAAVLAKLKNEKLRGYILVEINSFNENALDNSNPIEELGRCVSLMAEADAVVFCNAWEDSRGCNVEYEVAMQYKIPIYYL